MLELYLVLGVAYLVAGVVFAVVATGWALGATGAPASQLDLVKVALMIVVGPAAAVFALPLTALAYCVRAIVSLGDVERAARFAALVQVVAQEQQAKRRAEQLAQARREGLN